MSKLCSVEECDRPILAKGFCQKHYWRVYRHGDHNKVSRQPNGTCQEYFHNVVLTYDGDECLIWPYARSTKGYGRVSKDGKQAQASRLVCEDVNGPPPTPDHEAAHSCGNGHLGCVTKRHLRWATSKENHADRLVHGTDNRGERSGKAKLTEEDVRKIRALRGVKTQKEIAAEFGVTPTNISMIQTGHNWAWMEVSL